MMLEHTSDGDAAESDAEDGREVEGNARITAMLGLSLLIAFAIESVTVIDVARWPPTATRVRRTRSFASVPRS